MKFVTLLWVVLIAGGTAAIPGQALAAKKNVVLFVTDDQGQDAGCYGNPVIKTPNLDALAKEGTLFKYAFATTASCSASRSVILTGLHNHANAHYGHEHSYHHFSSYDWVKTLPVIMEKAGYRTARIGKYHVAPAEVYRFQQALPGNSRNPVQMANNVRELIGEKSDKPFFLYFCTSDPHRGGGVDEESPYKPNLFGNNEQYPGVTEVEYDPKDVIVPPFLPDTPTCRAELAEYYQSVSRIDQGLGQLIRNLKEAGVYEDTLIIYTADHGIAFPGGKTTTYEGGLRAPLVVRHPYAAKRGIVSEAMISWIDLTPTIVDFAGALDPRTGGPSGVTMAGCRRNQQQPYKFHGRSFLSTLEQARPQGWDEINASHTFHEIQMYYPMRVVRDRKWKLIWNIAHPLPYPFASDLWAAATWQAQYKQGPTTPYGVRTVYDYIHRPQFELYDIEKDPWEARNVATDPANGKVLAQMKERLKQFQQRTNDPWIMKWEYE